MDNCNCDMYNCCDCGGFDCGCAYCWSCNACNECKGIIECPSCENDSSIDEWYKVSNDTQAICPSCSGVIDYNEFDYDWR